MKQRQQQQQQRQQNKQSLVGLSCRPPTTRRSLDSVRQSSVPLHAV